jgi:ketosteroid isomerase-like protein
LQERSSAVTLVAVADHSDTVRRAFEVFNERDIEAFLGFCHPDVEWIPPVELPESRAHRGREGVREAIGELLMAFPDLRAVPARVEQVGDDAVLGLYTWCGSGQASGASIDSFDVRAGTFAEFEGELVRRIRFWADWESAVEAAGLSA